LQALRHLLHECILLGCSVPVILRPNPTVDGVEDAFEFIGEAYVHGIMDDEALAGKDKEETVSWTQRFKLI
jgi:hypothetical protein